MKKTILVLIATLLAFPMTSTHATEQPIKVMSRNLYLGADVGVALAKIPNMPAAAQFMWDQVQQTDFSKRKKFEPNLLMSSESRKQLFGTAKPTSGAKKPRFLTSQQSYLLNWVVITSLLKRMV